ncbi:conserved hypothetical protein [Rhodopseudomonas palustris HaA2]|uniref:Uncharacterized protein n=1 Tax=Rhodopseudomonas palustris (strain HaA2) TaxID=316058 RepID=Q2J2V5_RHOP2|nr:hypothetical protein [Rhodopseudomonas palustris]ABD05205.1 conserved hypothetical protein [Rhodopseudomonas palustris HaA2]
MRAPPFATMAAALLAAALPTSASVTSAAALTAQECSARYQAAKTAGTLNGQGWNDFRKAQCGGDTATAEAKDKAEPTADSKAEAKTGPKTDAKPKAKPKSAEPATPQGPAVYPASIDAKFAKEKPTLARLHTCAEQWKANKAANTTGGLRWIQKGGGYWSECNKRLKG